MMLADPNNNGTTLITNMINMAVQIINTSRETEATFNTEQQTINSYESGIQSGVQQIEGELPKIRERRDNSQKDTLQGNISGLLSQTGLISSQIANILQQPQLLTISNYTLEYIIPKNPFFSYTNTTDNTYYIVYGTTDAIYVDSSVITTLNSVVTPFYSNPPTYNDTTGNPYPLFLNQTGATNLITNNLSDEIYIDCQPTGSSNEQTNVTTSTTLNPSKTSSIKFAIFVIFFIIVLVVIYMIFAYITHPDKKNFSIGSIKNPFTQ
jgi:hypothetical protein